MMVLYGLNCLKIKLLKPHDFEKMIDCIGIHATINEIQFLRRKL